MSVHWCPVDRIPGLSKKATWRRYRSDSLQSKVSDSRTLTTAPKDLVRVGIGTYHQGCLYVTNHPCRGAGGCWPFSWIGHSNANPASRQWCKHAWNMKHRSCASDEATLLPPASAPNAMTLTPSARLLQIGILKGALDHLLANDAHAREAVDELHANRQRVIDAVEVRLAQRLWGALVHDLQ